MSEHAGHDLEDSPWPLDWWDAAGGIPAYRS